ncbi:MAG: NADH-quinone oxidoreductase subunit H [Eubacteriales bacterium]|jgi:NADH-quinone oxidoreductase subunit H|nr:NADH-quinone oxidoreductase subunit H [Eubacteriales bacterium]
MTFLINLVQLLIFPGLLFCVVFGVLMAGIDRKLVARMQRRVGPPILQPWYDFVKCCAKETIIPRCAKKAIFIGAPYLGLACLIVIALFIPVGSYGSAFTAGADLVVILYLLTIAGVTLIIGASSTGSPYAGVGLSREMVAMISYELPFVLVLLAVGRVAGADSGLGCTFSLSTIAAYQAANGPLIAHWALIPAAIAMLLVIPCEVGSHPFDIAEAETEICEGALAEYSGHPLGVFRLSHYVKMYIMTALFCAMFLGGITVGLAGTVGVVVDVLIFLVLCGVVSFICMTLPHAVCARLRVEQVFKFYWTVVAGLAALSLVMVWAGL